MNRLPRFALTAILASSALLGVAAPASADTAVMGSTLANDFEGGISTAPTVSVQLSFDPGTSPNPVVSPANGVITGWKVKSADDGAIYTLKVLRPNGPVSLVTATNSNFSAIASVQAPSAVPAGTGVGTPTGVIFSYPASLPISKGDYVGVLTGGADDHVPQKTTNGLAQNLIANNFSGLPADGAAADLLADEQHDLLLQATIQFCKVPNLKGLKRGAAVQALAAADCAAGKVKKKKLKRSKKTKKKKGKVLKQSLAPGSTAAPGTAVDLKIAGLRKKSKKS
jgi:PASTA domain